jgi:hypothetical protein
MTIEEKMSIARGIVTPLLRKIGAGKYELSMTGQFVVDSLLHET